MERIFYSVERSVAGSEGRRGPSPFPEGGGGGDWASDYCWGMDMQLTPADRWAYEGLMFGVMKMMVGRQEVG